MLGALGTSPSPISGGVDQIAKNRSDGTGILEGVHRLTASHLYDLRDKIVDSMLIGLVLFLFAEGIEVGKAKWVWF